MEARWLFGVHHSVWMSGWGLDSWWLTRFTGMISGLTQLWRFTGMISWLTQLWRFTVMITVAVLAAVLCYAVVNGGWLDGVVRLAMCGVVCRLPRGYLLFQFVRLRDDSVHWLGHCVCLFFFATRAHRGGAGIACHLPGSSDRVIAGEMV